MNEETLENPVTGELIRVLESTPERFKIQYSLGPRAEIPAEHFHPGKEQRISIVSGEMHLRTNGAQQVVRAGETATVPAGARHFQWNPTDSEVVAIEEIVPAGRIHEYFAVVFGLARDGKTDSQGRPSLLLSSALFSTFKNEIRLAPVAARVVLDLCWPIARLLGYRRQLDPYLFSGGPTSR